MTVYFGPNPNLSFKDIVTDGLIAYLNTDNYPGSGESITDLTGNNNNGVLINSPTYTSSNGGILSFNGFNQAIRFPATQISNLTGPISISVAMFCKSDYFSSNGWSTFWSGISKYSQFILGPNAVNGKMAFLIYTDTWYPLGYGGSIWGQEDIDPREYHYYVGVYDQPAGMQYLYIDGDLEVSFNVGSMSLLNDNDIWWVGKRDVSETYLQFSMGSVQLYNKALSQQEVIKNFNALRGRFGV
jgi:hypothetical protein